MSQTSNPDELSGLYAHCQFCGHTVSLALATAPTQVHRLKCAHCGFKAAEIRQRHPDGHSSTLARSCLGCSQSIPPARGDGFKALMLSLGTGRMLIRTIAQ